MRIAVVSVLLVALQAPSCTRDATLSAGSPPMREVPEHGSSCSNGTDSCPDLGTHCEGQNLGCKCERDNECDAGYCIQGVCGLSFAFAAHIPIGCEMMGAGAVADLDGDARPDIIVGCHRRERRNRSGPGGAIILTSRADGTYSERYRDLSVELDDLSIADVNGDDRADLVAAETDIAALEKTGSTLRVWLNDGTGDFLPPVTSAVTAKGAGVLVTGDFNGDERHDAALASQVFLSDGTGRLVETFRLEASGRDVVDLDCDNRDDVLILRWTAQPQSWQLTVTYLDAAGPSLPHVLDIARPDFYVFDAVLAVDVMSRPVLAPFQRAAAIGSRHAVIPLPQLRPSKCLAHPRSRLRTLTLDYGLTAVAAGAFFGRGRPGVLAGSAIDERRMSLLEFTEAGLVHRDYFFVPAVRLSKMIAADLNRDEFDDLVTQTPSGVLILHNLLAGH